MKGNSFKLMALVLLFPLVASAQDEEWETQFASSIGFQIDLPKNWTNSFEETRGASGFFEVLGSSTNFNPKTNKTRSIIITATAYETNNNYSPPVSSDMSMFKKQIKKEAKKAKDPDYRIIDEGTGTINGMETQYSWVEYASGTYDRSGKRSILRQRMVSIYPVGRMNRYVIKVVFAAPRDSWEDSAVYFEQVLKSYDEF